MPITTIKYVRKPLFVDAVRITGANFDEIASWCQGEIQTEENLEKGEIKKYIRVRVHNPKNPRQTKAYVGDWLLYTERGYKVYSSKAFHASFEEVRSDDRSEVEESTDWQGPPKTLTPESERDVTPERSETADHF